MVVVVVVVVVVAWSVKVEEYLVPNQQSHGMRLQAWDPASVGIRGAEGPRGSVLQAPSLGKAPTWGTQTQRDESLRIEKLGMHSFNHYY